MHLMPQPFCFDNLVHVHKSHIHLYPKLVALHGRADLIAAKSEILSAKEDAETKAKQVNIVMALCVRVTWVV